MFKRILVPLDGSRFASRSLKYAQELAQPLKAEVILLQVVKPAIPVAGASGVEAGMQSPSSARIAVEIALNEDKRNVSHAGRYLSRKSRELKAQGIQASHKVVVGDPAETIMAYAKKAKADLIIMTTHGKSGIIRAVMGSVADEVVRKSGKPVLVARPKGK